MPTTPRDAKGLLKQALRSDDPVFFLEHKSLLNVKGHVPDPEEDEVIPFGRRGRPPRGDRRHRRRDRPDGPATARSSPNHSRPKASRSKSSTSARSPRSIIDTILASVHKTGRFLIVDEDFPIASIGAEISAQVTERAFDDLDAPIRRLNGVYTPVPYSPPLEAAVTPNKDQIAKAIRELANE